MRRSGEAVSLVADAGAVGPDLLVKCESALDMSRELVRTWLETFMFKELSNRSEMAKSISEWLADHKHFKSHARHIPRTEIENHGLTIFRLEDDQAFQDFALSVFHSVTHTFTEPSAVKIIENHTGRAFVKSQVVQSVPAIQLGIAQVTPDGSGPTRGPDLLR